MTTRVYALLGYGCHLTAALRRYLDQAADRIRDDLDDTAVSDPMIFFSGGFTMQRSAPGISEARLMADYLKEQGLALPQVLDEAARTTLENLRHLAAHCATHAIAATDVAICCDSARKAKISYAAARLLDGQPRLLTFDLARTKLQIGLQETAGLAYDAVALKLPWVERIGLKLIDARNRRW